MTVSELIEKLKECNPNATVCIDSYYIDEDYDWDENLELNYIDCPIEAEGVSEDNFEDEDRIVLWCYHSGYYN